MKAITVCQPYAHLIALGAKPVENRQWATPYRGPLLVHAGLSFAWLRPGDRAAFPDMAFGAIVARAELVACLRLTSPAHGPAWPSRFRALHTHEHAEGPWCWVLEDVRRLRDPIACRGDRRLWTPPRVVLERVQAALEAVA